MSSFLVAVLARVPAGHQCAGVPRPAGSTWPLSRAGLRHEQVCVFVCGCMQAACTWPTPLAIVTFSAPRECRGMLPTQRHAVCVLPAVSCCALRCDLSFALCLVPCAVLCCGVCCALLCAVCHIISVAVPRKAKEAIGAIARLTATDSSGRAMTVRHIYACVFVCSQGGRAGVWHC